MKWNIKTDSALDVYHMVHYLITEEFEPSEYINMAINMAFSKLLNNILSNESENCVFVYATLKTETVSHVISFRVTTEDFINYEIVYGDTEEDSVRYHTLRVDENYPNGGMFKIKAMDYLANSLIRKYGKELSGVTKDSLMEFIEGSYDKFLNNEYERNDILL